MEEIEIWADIRGYEGHYQVSNLGRVKILDKIKVGRVGNTYIKKGGLKKHHLNENGYCRTALTDANGILRTKSVHRLVAIAFIENPNNLPEVNHLDGNKQNNYFKNLEWATESNNMLHAFRTGLKVNAKGITGEGVSNSKKVAQYDKVGKLIKIWGCIYDVKRAGIVSNPTKISLVAKGKLPHYKGFIWKYAEPSLQLSPQ